MSDIAQITNKNIIKMKTVHRIIQEFNEKHNGGNRYSIEKDDSFVTFNVIMPNSVKLTTVGFIAFHDNCVAAEDFDTLTKYVDVKFGMHVKLNATGEKIFGDKE